MEKIKNGKIKTEQELAVLHEIIGTISYSLDLKEVLGKIIGIVGQVTKADSCLLYLINDGELVLRASQNPHSNLIGKVKLRVGEGITGWVAENKKTVVISEKAYQDDRFKVFNNLPEDKFEAFLSVPIVYKDNILGVINVQHKNQRHYDKNEIALFETIAKATGGAIENARLFEEGELLRDALESRKLIEKAKGILMKELGINEEEAYKSLHRKSMDKRISMKDVANAIILSNEFKKP